MINPIDALRGARAMFRVVSDPKRLDEVFVLADLSENTKLLDEMVRRLRDQPEMVRVFEDRPRLGDLDRPRLARSTEGTLGRAYGDFMTERGLRHEDLKLVDDDHGDIDWIRNHLRETHDLWHVVTGFDTDVAGELGLQAFYLAQMKSPLAVLILAIGMLNTLFKEMHDAGPRMTSIARGWVLGTRSRPLFGLRFMDWLDRPLEELRAEYALDIESVEAFLAVTPPEVALSEAA